MRLGGKGMNRGLIIDVETTGLDTRLDEIVELAAVPFEYDALRDRLVAIPGSYVGLREPSVRIGRQATAVHGITAAMVAGTALDDDLVAHLLTQADFLVAHNAQFDFGFVTRAYPLASRRPWLCSLRHIDWARHGHFVKNLSALAAGHRIAVPRAHRAAGDCQTLLHLLACAGTDGRSYCAELLTHLPATPPLQSRTPIRPPRPRHSRGNA